MPQSHTPRTEQPVGETALSYTVSADWGHFRRIDTTTTRQTYRVIPRTTVEGLTAAVMGWDRNSYYHHFTPEQAAIAVVPEAMVNESGDPGLQTRPIAKNELTVGKSDFADIDVDVGGETVSGGVVAPEQSLEHRQQRVTEYLRSPSYRIFLTFADTDLQQRVHEQFASGEAVYSPSLGKSECLARIEYHGEAPVERAEDTTVHSTLRVEDTVPDGAFRTERTPYHMVADGSYRYTSGFVSYSFRQDGPLECTDTDAVAQCDGLTVQFG